MRNIKATIEVLTQDEIVMIHKAALNLLEKTGFSMPNNECLRRLEKAGAKVDMITGVVKVPVSVMEDYIVQMRAAQGGLPTQIEKIYGGISTQVFVTDYKTKTRRLGTTDDVKKGIALVKHLDNIPSCNASTIPTDVDERIRDIHAFHQIYKYSEKGGGTYITTAAQANCIMDMTEAMGRKTGYLFESISPLKFRPETLEMGLMFADRGHGLGVAPMIMGGSTGPITMAGTITLVTAEVLCSLFSVYAITGEVNAFFAHGSHTTDPSTMLCSFGSPNQALIGVGAAQMAKHYGILAGSNSALSDALMPDFQAGFEKSMTAIFSLLAGTVSIGCQGIAGADQGFSFEQLLIDNEWLDAYNYVISGYDVSEETIALDLMHEIGIGGNFLSEEHTVAHIRDSWWPSKLFTRQDFDVFVNSKTPDLLYRAHALVEEYTQGYKDMEPVVDGKTADELDRIYNAGVAAITK